MKINYLGVSNTLFYFLRIKNNFYYEKIICYYLGRIRPSDMRNRFNSIRYKESDSVSWYTSSLIFLSYIYLNWSYKASFFLHFCGQFLVRKSGQWSEIFVQAVVFIFLDREKVVKWSEKVGKWSVFGQF